MFSSLTKPKKNLEKKKKKKLHATCCGPPTSLKRDSDTGVCL